MSPLTIRRDIIIGFIVVAVFSPIFWWTFLDRDVPYDFVEGVVKPQEAQIGSPVTITWRVNVHRVCPGVVYRQIVDSAGKIHNYDPIYAMRREQLTTTQHNVSFSRTFILPVDARPGPATYRAYYCYRCNPIQDMWPICGYTQDVPFTMLPGKNEPYPNMDFDRLPDPTQMPVTPNDRLLKGKKTKIKP